MTSLVLETRDLNFIFRTLDSACVPAEDREAVLRLYFDQLSLPIEERDSYQPTPHEERLDLRRTGEIGIVGQHGFLPARVQSSILNSRFARCLVRRHEQDPRQIVSSCANEANSVLIQEFSSVDHPLNLQFPVLPDQICVNESRGPNSHPTRANPCSLTLDDGGRIVPNLQNNYTSLPSNYTVPAHLGTQEVQVCRQLQSEFDRASHFQAPYTSSFQQATTVAAHTRFENSQRYLRSTEPLLPPSEANPSFLRNYRDFLVQRIQDGTRTVQAGDQVAPRLIGDPPPRSTITAEESEAQARVSARPGDPRFGSGTRLVWNWSATPAPFLLPVSQRMNLFELGIATNRYGTQVNRDASYRQSHPFLAFLDNLNFGGSVIYAANFTTGDQNLMLSASLQYNLRDSPVEFFRQFHLRVSALGGVNLNHFNTADVGQRENFIAGVSVDLTSYSNMSCLIPSILLMLPAPQEMDRCLRTPQRALNVPTSSVSFGVSLLFPELDFSNTTIVGNVSIRNFHNVGWLVDGALLLSGLIYSLTQTR